MTKKELKIELINHLLDEMGKAQGQHMDSADIFAYGLEDVADHAQVIHVERKACWNSWRVYDRYYLQFLTLPKVEWEGCRVRCSFDTMGVEQRTKVASFIFSLLCCKQNTFQFDEWFYTAYPAGMQEQLRRYYGFVLLTYRKTDGTKKVWLGRMIETLASEKPADSCRKAYVGETTSLIWCDSKEEAERQAACYMKRY